MLHINRKKLTDTLTEEEMEEHTLYMRIYGGFLKYGLALYEPDGNMEGTGLEMLEMTRDHFQKWSATGRAARVQGFIDEYKKHWPHLKANYNFNHRSPLHKL